MKLTLLTEPGHRLATSKLEKRKVKTIDILSFRSGIAGTPLVFQYRIPVDQAQNKVAVSDGAFYLVKFY